MITITKEMAADLFNILASATHTKYSWQQVNMYLAELQKKLNEAKMSKDPTPTELFTPGDVDVRMPQTKVKHKRKS